MFPKTMFFPTFRLIFQSDASFITGLSIDVGGGENVLSCFRNLRVR